MGTEPQVTKSIRRRVNVTRGMRGAYGFEFTCDTENYTPEELMEEVSKLQALLEAKYPLKLEELK